DGCDADGCARRTAATRTAATGTAVTWTAATRTAVRGGRLCATDGCDAERAATAVRDGRLRRGRRSARRTQRRGRLRRVRLCAVDGLDGGGRRVAVGGGLFTLAATALALARLLAVHGDGVVGHGYVDGCGRGAGQL